MPVRWHKVLHRARSVRCPTDLGLGHYHIKINALCPGLAASDMHWTFVESDAKARGISFEEIKTIELEEIPRGRYMYGADMD